MIETISRKAAIKEAESWVAIDEYEKHLQKNVVEWLKEFPSAEHGTNLAEVGKDCISRQAAIDRLTEYGNGRAVFISVGEAVIRIEQLPSAEPQIIRCKDCKNWDTTWTNDFSPNYHYCPMVDGSHKEDWFCADAERRTDG